MKNIMISFVFAIVANSALANPVPETNSEVNSALLDRYGVAVMIEASGQHSIPASNRIYQSLVGKLQREMRKADILVFNGVLPQTNSSAEFDRTQLKDTIRKLDNPYLDAVLLISASVYAGKDSETVPTSDITLQLTLEFVDASTGLPFSEIDESLTLPIVANCKIDCVLRSVNRQVISMGPALTSKAIVAMQFDIDPGEYRIAAAR